ncbi:hypothetical protein IIA79_04210 [bacterium]|nr:hypothetical protein [bacterium]
MDSRIREIEQWWTEAKESLGEGGREVYLRKLYLLDAEIRAVIRENGILPGDVFPRSRAKKVWRFLSPAWAFGTAGGALFLAAATVLVANLTGMAPESPFNNSTRLAADAPGDLSGTPGRTWDLALYTIPGEEILPGDWLPPVQGEARELAPTSPVLVEGAQSLGVVLASAGASPIAQDVTKPKAPMGTASRHAGEATDVALVGFAPQTEAAALRAPAATSFDSSYTSSSGGMERTIAAARFAYFPPQGGDASAEGINKAKDAIAKNSKNGSPTEVVLVGETVDNVDNEEFVQTESVDKYNFDPYVLLETAEREFRKKSE